MGRRILTIAVLSLSVLMTIGCAGAPPRRAVDIPEVVAKLPMEQTWPEVEKLLLDQGWGVELREGYKMASPWRRAAQNNVAPAGQMEVERVVVMGQPLADGGCAVKFARQSRFVQEEGFAGAGNTTINTVFWENHSRTDGVDPEYMRSSKREVGPTSPIVVERVAALENALVERLRAKVAASR